MKKIKLKYPIMEFNEALSEMGFNLPHQEEIAFPNYPPKPSEAQEAQRQFFKLAQAYVVEALADPELRAHYKEIARIQGKRPRDIAVSDYFDGNDLLSKKQAK